MIADFISFRGHRCFKNEWVGFETIKPINIIIGRNNTGKSHLLELAAAVCDWKLDDLGFNYRCDGVLEEKDLRRHFLEGHIGGALQGDHWHSHGKQFIGLRVAWEVNYQTKIPVISFPDGFNAKSPHGQESTNVRLGNIRGIVSTATHRLSKSIFRRLLADRDIRPEHPSNEMNLRPDGAGATNIIRRYIVTSNPQFPQRIVQTDLLGALNTIFAKDGRFTGIQVKHHDDNANGDWEVFLGEEKKGLIPLSSSGSGLKTVILVLLNLLVVPAIECKLKEQFVFAFEELENNLHPALLRRLFQYLENYAVTEKATIFITTHSSIALDLFGVSKNAQIIHVTHDGESARATTVSAHFDHLGVISELGAKPSDLLQANGIIWVEGPSDCIYMNRWIDLYTDGRFQEGRDYQCAFYGGSLLARTQFKSPEDAEAELVNLFRVNPNIIVLCDGDRTAAGKRVKDRVRRIRAEVMKIPGAHIWVTDAREIENYIPGPVLAKAMEFTKPLPDPTQYEMFFPRTRSPGRSYIERTMKRKGLDKMDLAVLAVPHLAKPMMTARFEWEAQMKQIVERIDMWNKYIPPNESPMIVIGS